jgi:hypothetical protein
MIKKNVNLPKKLEEAKIDNVLVFHGQYQLTAKESKVILYLISKIDPIKQKRLHEQTVPVKELESILKEEGKKWGGLYKEMKAFQRRMMGKLIEFPTDIEVGGRKLPGMVNWFQSIAPVKNDKGEVSIEFLFSEKLKPFLLDLKEYVSIDLLELLPLKSSFSIRMFQVFRAHRNRMAAHQKKSMLRYEIEELKSLLGISGKYEDYRNFRKKVLTVVEKEMQQTSIGMKWAPIKEGKTIVAVEFEFWDRHRKSKQLQISLAGDLNFETLTFSQTKAFDQLAAYGVNDQIVMQMLAKAQGSEIRGFEDWYFEECIKIVELKSTMKMEGSLAGVLVNWFLKLKVFEQGDHFAKIMETLAARKKALEKSNVSAWENRLLARNMTAGAFRESLKG